MCWQHGKEESGVEEEKFSCGGEVGEGRDGCINLGEWERSRSHKVLLVTLSTLDWILF